MCGVVCCRRKMLLRRSGAGRPKPQTVPQYAGFAEAMEAKEDVLQHQDIEFDIYRHPYPTHIHVNPQEGCPNQGQLPCYNEYLYTLRLDNQDTHKDPHLSEGIMGQNDVISGDMNPGKKCTCRHGQTYEIPAGLTSGTATSQVASVPSGGGQRTGVSTYLEWEHSSLLLTDHEPDVIHVTKSDVDNDG